MFGFDFEYAKFSEWKIRRRGKDRQLVNNDIRRADWREQKADQANKEEKKPIY